MPRIPGIPKRPQYHSVKAYLSELAKDIAEMVVDPAKMKRFREQLQIYANLWKQWKTFDEAERLGRWDPSMGRPECIFNVFSQTYNPLKNSGKEVKRLAGSYALCALIHDCQLPHLDKINAGIIPIEAIEETLSSPRNTLEALIVGNWNSGQDVREIYLIEEFFNRVKVDLRELCNLEKNKLTKASIEEQIQNENELSNTEFLELTAKKFEQRTKKVISKDETWHDLDRSLKGWFDTAIGRLKKSGFQEKDLGLLKYLYKNLLHFARGINIKSFRGFPDPSIVSSARKAASELAAIFKDLAKRLKDNLASEKKEEVEASTQGYMGQRCQVPTSDADRQRAYRDGYTVGDYKPDTEQYIVPGKKAAEKDDKQDTSIPTYQPDSIIGDTWSILGIPINVKKLYTKFKSHPILLICCFSVIVIVATQSLWHPLIEKTNHGTTESANIFADVSKDGTILRSNNFPWKIKKSINHDGNILYTMIDRRGDATAISVVSDNPKYTVYQSLEGMVIKYTCAEEKIQDFTIKVKY